YRQVPFGTVSRFLSMTYPLEAILKRLNSELSLKITIMLTAICNPIRKRTCKVPWIDRIASRIFPSACYYNSYPLLDPDVIYEWNELDTHDKLTAYYRHFRTSEEIHSCLEHLGFQDIKCGVGGNGVEARAIYPCPI